MLLHERASDRPRHGHGAVRRKGYAIKACHDCISIGNTAMHSRRTGAAEQHRTVAKPGTRLQEHLANISRGGRLERAACVEGHHDDENERVNGVPCDDLECVGLAENAPVVQPDDDMGHDLHRVEQSAAKVASKSSTLRSR